MIKVEKNKVTLAGTPADLLLEVTTLLQSLPDIFNEMKAAMGHSEDDDRGADDIKNEVKKILDELLRGQK